jgi:hypothetical protein
LGQQSTEKRDGEKQRIHDSYDLAVSVVIGEEAAKTRTLAEPPNKQDSKELSSRRRREPGAGGAGAGDLRISAPADAALHERRANLRATQALRSQMREGAMTHFPG